MFGEQPLLDRLWLPFTCSTAVDALGVMVANGSVTTNGQLILQTVQPSNIADFQQALFVNGPTDVAANGYGRCTLAAAPVFALYSGTAPATGDKCGLQANSWSLAKDRPGFIALDAGSDNKVLVVAQKDVMLFGKLDGSLSQGSTAMLSVWADDPLANTSDNITVTDWFLGSGESIDSGKKIGAKFYGGNWYAVTAEC